MTDKERLEEIDKRAKHIVLENSRGEVRYRFTEINTEDFDWLIEQAKLTQYFGRKNAELNEFLNKYSEAKHLGKNVIDVAMDIIEKQAERVQELEETVVDYKTVNKELHQRGRKVRKQNKRYREILNASRGIIKDAIYALDNNKKVQGLEFAVKIINRALEGEE